MRSPIPLKKRKSDYIYLSFFVLNLSFITYVVDIEQIVIFNPAQFNYPIWPLPFLVDMVHWWGSNFDPLQWARPVWWKATIWLDVVFFGPYYAFAIFAFIRGKDWIRIPTIIYSTMLFTNVFIIMSEEYWGPYATHSPLIVTLANAPWCLFPVFLILKMWKHEHPFTVESYD
ncbi:MAG: emopamil-binding family protein [Bacteroidales bacterium]|nr:emopamil-binding family protein [Bacteroidales bacterium]